MADPDPIGENESTHDTENKADTKNSGPKADIPPIGGVPSLPPSITHHHITYKPEKDWWDKLRPFVEIAGAALLAIYTFFTIKMYCANKEAADAATSAANTAADTLTRSIEQFRIDERAWIEIEPPTLIFKAPASATYGGALFTYDFFLKNVGKTAAFDIAVRAPRGAIDSGLSLGDDSAQIARLQETLTKNFFGTKLTPNDEVILLSERNSKTLGPGVRAFSAFQLYGQEPRFKRYRFLVGRIDYNDAFSISHWNTFCFYIDTSGALRYCREGNNEDRNAEIKPTIATPKK